MSRGGLFRYSGSKHRLLGSLLGPPANVAVIVEPFAGSLAYAMAHRPARIVAAEANPLVRGLWEWLRTTATVAALDALERAMPQAKVDVRSLGLSAPETTLMRLQVCGAYVGQLSSFRVYPQHALRLDALKAALPYVKRALAPLLVDYREVVIPPASVAFVDPPYLGTAANYKSKRDDHGQIDARDVEDFVLRLSCPTIVTYGDDAATAFPRLPWEKIAERRVPILRGGGTRLRVEHAAYLNWR